MKITQIAISNKARGISERVKYIRTIHLEGFIKSVLVGFLLTDAGAYRTRGSTGNTRIEWSFGSKQALFASYVNSLFVHYVNTPVRSIPVTINSVNTTQYRLKTVSLPIFNMFRDLFYTWDVHANKWTKIVPSNITELIDPIVLAFIIIGDGNFNENRIRIYLNAFTEDEVKLICQATFIKLGINAVVRHDRKNQYMIVVPSKEIGKTRSIVKMYIHESIIYRIGC